MYDKTDPRSALSAAKPASVMASEFAGAEYAKFYETEPDETGPEGKSWYARGQNFVIVYSEAAPGAVFERKNQIDEYVVLLPDPQTRGVAKAVGQTKELAGYSVTFLPPGNSSLQLAQGGRLVRMFTTRSKDVAEKSSNAQSYGAAHPNIPAFQPWPEPKAGWAIRSYSLDVPDEPGRFGRIFRCTTFMVNYLPSQKGPRDITKLSPHHHDDFEQCSLALQGAFTHHLRWPWTVDMNAWRKDDHEYCGSPSVTVIPPPAIHTSRGMEQGVNQLVDIFSPPRVDFSMKPGWVLNSDDYPMP
jgi:hypothetical protein